MKRLFYALTCFLLTCMLSFVHQDKRIIEKAENNIVLLSEDELIEGEH